jgi:hypothetical protein
MVLAANPSLREYLRQCAHIGTDGWSTEPDGQLYAIPFAKSAATSQHAPVSSFVYIHRNAPDVV